MTDPTASPDGVVVRESRLQRDGLYGFLTVATALAVVRGVASASTTAGRLSAAVVLGAVLVVVVGGWVRAVRRADRLEISPSVVRYVPGAVGAPPVQLLRADGAQLRLATRGSGRVVLLELVQVGSPHALELRHFSQAAVRRTCVDAGWQLPC